ncbi:MAG: hypothetical protein IKD18_03795, partial [Clostridia bacterium]|nr:hypothetical protein [Clostridia bacterium]
MENKEKKNSVSRKGATERVPAKKQSSPKKAAPSGRPKSPSGNKSKSAFSKMIARIVLTLSKYAGKIVTYALNVVLTVLLIGIITGSAVACALVVYIKNYVDPYYDIEDLKTDSSLTTFVYYQQKKEDGSTDWVEWEEERIYGTENSI